MISTLVVSILALLPAPLAVSSTSSVKRVAVVDTGLDFNIKEFKPYLCPDGHKDFTGLGIRDQDGHGSEVVGFIIANAKDSNYCLVIYKFYTNKVRRSWNRALLQALEEIKTQNIELANLSLSGEGFLQDENDYFLSNRTTTFVTAAGNDGVDLSVDPRYPASYGYNNILVVGALDYRTGKKLKSSNYGKQVKFWEEAEATSYATAIKTGKIIKENFGIADDLR